MYTRITCTRITRGAPFISQLTLLIVIPPFVVRMRSDVPPPLIVPRSELLLVRVVATGRSLLIEPLVVEASRLARARAGNASLIGPLVVSKLSE